MDYPVFAAGVKGESHLAPVILFFGEEPYLGRQGLALIRGIAPESAKSEVRFSSQETTWGRVLDELLTPPFEGGRKLVVIEDEGNWFHNEAPNLQAYVTAPSATALLVGICSSSKSPLTFESEKLMQVKCAPLRLNELRFWVTTRIQEDKKTIDPPALDLLLSRAGFSLAFLDQTLESLKSYLGSRRKIAMEEIRNLVSDDTEHAVFELALWTARKNLPKSLEVLHRLLRSGEASSLLLWRLAWQYRKMIEAKRLLLAGVRRFEVTSHLQVTFYPEEFLGFVDAHSEEELLRKHEALLEADIALKTSGSGAEETILDRLVAGLASGPELTHPTFVPLRGGA